MPRSSRSSGFRSSRSARPSASSSSGPRPTTQQRSASTSSSSVPAKQPAAPAATPAAPAAAPAAAPQGPGFLAGMAQIAGGVALGHAITGAVGSLMGGSDESSGEVRHAQEEYEDEDPCFEKRHFFDVCLKRYGTDISSCQTAMDALRECESRLQ